MRWAIKLWSADSANLPKLSVVRGHASDFHMGLPREGVGVGSILVEGESYFWTTEVAAPYGLLNLKILKKKR